MQLTKKVTSEEANETFPSSTFLATPIISLSGFFTLDIKTSKILS